MPVTVTHAKSNTKADFTGTVTGYNSGGASTTFLATDLIRPSDWNSAHQITLSLAASELASLFVFNDGLLSSSDSSGITVGFDNDMFFEPFPLHNTNSTLSAPGIGTWYLDPFISPHGFDSGAINIFMTNAAGFLNGAVYSAASSGSITRTQTLYNRLAIYKQGTGANRTKLDTVWTGNCDMFFTWERRVGTTVSSQLTVSNYLTASFPAQWDSSGNATYSSTAQSGTTSVAASTGASTIADGLITGVVAYVSGARQDFVPFAKALDAGQYWMAHMCSSASASAGTNYSTGTMMSTQSRAGLLENNLAAYKSLGSSVSNSTSGPVRFHGFLATTTSGASSVIATSDIRHTTGRMYWNAIRY